jgi:hypothetical protein
MISLNLKIEGSWDVPCISTSHSKDIFVDRSRMYSVSALLAFKSVIKTGGKGLSPTEALTI